MDELRVDLGERAYPILIGPRLIGDEALLRPVLGKTAALVTSDRIAPPVGPFVATVIVAVLLLNTPEAPDPGAVNVTFTPLTGLLPASFTVTARGNAKAVLMVAD